MLKWDEIAKTLTDELDACEDVSIMRHINNAWMAILESEMMFHPGMVVIRDETTEA